MSRKVKLIVALLISFSSFSYAQEKENKRSHFIEPTYMFGKVLPMSTFFTFPEASFQHVAALNIGTTNNDTAKWGRYYNLPESGIMLLYSNLGNNDILGHQFGVLPFVTFRVFNKLRHPLQLQLGAGVSFFTHHFDSISNPQNEVIGAPLTWDVKAFLYQSIYKKNGFRLKLGIGFSHESNGHTTLPNLGINSPMASLSAQFYNKREDNFFKPTRVKRQNVCPKKYYITWETGLGFHEQDETEGPPMGQLKPVYSADLSAGILFNRHIKLRAGFNYRYYQTYYDHIINTNDAGLINQPSWNSSNLSFYLGNEFLMGHASIDALLGVNLHKPFYDQYNPGTAIGLTLQKRLLTRIGMNLYLINTHKLPQHNVYIGAHIKANMAKADYTDITIGYTFNLN